MSELLRIMRLIARKSQAEYAQMCDVAPRVLAKIEGGTGSPTVETLGKLLRPFGFRVGVVMARGESEANSQRRNERPKTSGSALSRALRRSRPAENAE